MNLEEFNFRPLEVFGVAGFAETWRLTNGEIHNTTNRFIFSEGRDGIAYFDKSEGSRFAVPASDILRVIPPANIHSTPTLVLSTPALCVRDAQGYGFYWKLPHVGKPEPIAGRPL
jgi:hypothetical protein